MENPVLERPKLENALSNRAGWPELMQRLYFAGIKDSPVLDAQLSGSDSPANVPSERAAIRERVVSL